jgi:hypothetical protein
MKYSRDWSKLRKTYPNQYNLIDDKVVEIKDVVVYSFRMSDVEDPDLMAAQPLYNWQTSEEGAWIMDHAVDQPVWHRLHDVSLMGWQYVIKAKLTAKDYTFWTLKWGT